MDTHKTNTNGVIIRRNGKEQNKFAEIHRTHAPKNAYMMDIDAAIIDNTTDTLKGIVDFKHTGECVSSATLILLKTIDKIYNTMNIIYNVDEHTMYDTRMQETKKHKGSKDISITSYENCCYVEYAITNNVAFPVALYVVNNIDAQPLATTLQVPIKQVIIDNDMVFIDSVNVTNKSDYENYYEKEIAPLYKKAVNKCKMTK